MINRIKSMISNIKMPSISIPSAAIGAAIGYFGHPVIKVAAEGVLSVVKLVFKI